MRSTPVQPGRFSARREWPRWGSGFTLMEVVISLVIVSILMVGMGGALIMSGKALPDDDSRIGTIAASANIAEQITSELAYATSFTEMTSTAVTFTVADRDSDSDPETIRYAWSGTAGDPLTRQYHGGPMSEVANSVQLFDLTYGLETESSADTTKLTEGDETQLVSRDLLSAGADYSITDGNAIGQYFAPALSADATEWSISRILVMAKTNGLAKGETYVRLCRADASKLPSATVLEEFVMAEKDLGGSYAWREFACSGVSGLATDDGICLTLTYKSKSPAADIQYDAGGGGGLLTSSNNGSTWLAAAGQSMRFYIYGTETTETTIPGESRSWLHSATVAIQISADPSTRVETTTRVLNKPEVTP